MPRYVPPKLDTRTLIDRDRDNQNGYGFDDFVIAVNNNTVTGGRVINKTGIGRQFNKDRQTINDWIERLKNDQSKVKAD